MIAAITGFFGTGFTGALLGSRMFLYAAALLAGVCGYEGWKYHERQVGAIVVEQKIEQKADANAKLANEVRDAVATGQRGTPDPYGVR